MKTLGVITLALLLILITNFSCSNNDGVLEEDVFLYDDWNIYNGTNQINGLNITDRVFTPSTTKTVSSISVFVVLGVNITDRVFTPSTTKTDIDDTVCISDLPNTKFKTIRLVMHLPVHPDQENYKSSISSDGIIIRYDNGKITPHIVYNGELIVSKFFKDPNNNSIQLSEVFIDFIIPNDYNITKDNLEVISYEFDLIFRNKSTNEIVYSGKRSYDLLVEIC